MEFGWKRIWNLYGFSGLFSSKNKLFYFSVSLILIVLILLLSIKHTDDLIYTLINKIAGDGLSILPTLLGFNLGAYALLIGFLTNDNLRKAVTEGKEEAAKNALEKISSVFAINIITQAFTLLCSFLIGEFTSISDKIILSKSLDAFFYSPNYVSCVNYVVFIGILFLTLYSIVLVIQNAINVFDFNQLFTYFSTKKKDDITAE